MKSVNSQIFEDYNKLIENTYNEFMQSMSDDNFNFPDDKVITEKLNRNQLTWQREEKEYLGGKTPEQFFSSLVDTEILMDTFEQAAIFCDKDIPNALADVLVSSGEGVHERLLSIVLDVEYRRDSENVVIVAAALYVLGRTKKPEIINSLLELLMDCTENDDLLMESITAAIKQYGSSIQDTIIEFIEKQDTIDFRTEYLIMILPEVSLKNKCDKVYKLLKSSFLRMENKILGASALAEFGDGRAVPVLRGYVEKTLNTIDKETFYELKKSIETLGGSTEDLKFTNNGNNTYGNLFS